MGRTWGMMYMFTNKLCTVKLLLRVRKLVVLNCTIDGISL